jgi:hypothetical protein
MLILIPTSLIILVMLVLALLMVWYASTWGTERGWLVWQVVTTLG